MDSIEKAVENYVSGTVKQEVRKFQHLIKPSMSRQDAVRMRNRLSPAMVRALPEGKAEILLIRINNGAVSIKPDGTIKASFPEPTRAVRAAQDAEILRNCKALVSGRL